MKHIFTLILAFVFLQLGIVQAQEHPHEEPAGSKETTELHSDNSDHESHAHDEAHDEHAAESHSGDHSVGHGADMSPLFFVIVALLIGAAIRHLLRKSALPFTVWLLIIGLALGAMVRLGWFSITHIGSMEVDLGIVNLL